MFRKIKKIYFKIYHLFKFLGIFILIFGLKKNVYAASVVAIPDHLVETNSSCSINLVEPTVFLGQYTSGSTTPSHNPSWPYYSTYLIKVEPNTLYTYYSSYGGGNASYFVYLFKDLNNGYTSRKNNSSQTGTITTGNDTNYIALSQYFPSGNMSPDNLNLALYEGNYTGEFVEYQSCSTTPEPGDNVYSNFLTLYIDRLEYLANGFTENPYLLTMIGVIFSWIVLELFLKILHMKGGYHK